MSHGYLGLRPLRDFVKLSGENQYRKKEKKMQRMLELPHLDCQYLNDSCMSTYTLLVAVANKESGKLEKQHSSFKWFPYDYMKNKKIALKNNLISQQQNLFFN